MKITPELRINCPICFFDGVEEITSKVPRLARQGKHFFGCKICKTVIICTNEEYNKIIKRMAETNE